MPPVEHEIPVKHEIDEESAAALAALTQATPAGSLTTTETREGRLVMREASRPGLAERCTVVLTETIEALCLETVVRVYEEVVLTMRTAEREQRLRATIRAEQAEVLGEGDGVRIADA